MSSIDRLFQSLRASGRKALMPFITAGDPDLDFTAAVLKKLVSAGCPICELGIPYSDPIADGPVIQASYTRALAKQIKLSQILEMLGTTAPALSAPIVTMVSYAIVHRHGVEKYVAEAKASGVAGAIVPDLPVEESGPLMEICRRADFSLIQLITPTTPPDRAKRIAERTTGFIYYVSVAGITGERTTLPQNIVENVSRLREQTELPICIGFGISLPEHVRLLAPIADGLIVGSALVRRMAQVGAKSRETVLEEIGGYVRELLMAIKREKR
ncbi:MAG: tryptophan synthase subunit alpha [Pirellulales bacterium]|nr:tryptophan synthase subunit alpha [Pirellulales bacterium]